MVLLDRGVTNPIDGALVDLLREVLAETREHPDVGGLVLASASEKFFSIGFDLPALYDLGPDEVTDFYDRFTSACLDLYTWPGPTAAAVNGHAIAGGCILALCCDYRFVAEGRTLTGLNEIALGVPVPHLPQLILQGLVGDRASRRLLDSGEFVDAYEQSRLGIADRLLARDRLLAFAAREVAELAALPADAYAATKSQRVERIASLVDAEREARAAEFVRCWFSPAARELLGAARDKF